MSGNVNTINNTTPYKSPELAENQVDTEAELLKQLCAFYGIDISTIPTDRNRRREMVENIIHNLGPKITPIPVTPKVAVPVHPILKKPPQPQPQPQPLPPLPREISKEDILLTSSSTQEEVQRWFLKFRGGKFSSYAYLFEEDEGADLLAYTEQQLEKILKDTRASYRLYNAIRQFKETKSDNTG